MTRVVNAGNTTELAKQAVIGCVMVDLDFSSGHLYLNDGITEVVYAAHTYLPLGQFGGIEAVQESLDTLARPVVLTLSGVDAAIVGLAETDQYQNRSVVVYLGLLDQRTGALVATPETAWEGRMDYMEITLDKNLGTIKLNCEHRLRREPRIARYTNPDQQQLYAGDKFFDFVPSIQGFKSQWGNEKGVYGGPARGVNPTGPRGRGRPP